jgi:hypothetical protein
MAVGPRPVRKDCSGFTTSANVRVVRLTRELTDAGRVVVQRTGIAARLLCRNIVPRLGITEIAPQFGGSILQLGRGVALSSAAYCVVYLSPDSLVPLPPILRK